MAATAAISAKTMYAVTLVIQCRFSCSSCLSPSFFTSACRFLSRLSVLMIRLRASITSLRSEAISLVPDTGAAASAGGGVDILGAFVSSLMWIMLRERPWTAEASHVRRIVASARRPARPQASAVRRMALLLRLEEMEHQAQRDQVPTHVEGPRAVARVHRRAGDRVPLLEHRGDRPAQLPAQPEREVAGSRVGLVVGAVARAGVERVADPSPAVERESLAAPERRVEREQDGDALDRQVSAHRDPVVVEHVADLDLEVQLVVVLIAEGGEKAGLEDLVRGGLVVDVVAVAGDEARPAEESDGALPFLGDGGEGRGGGQKQDEGKAHLR